MERLFISVAGPDRPWARWIAQRLMAAGYEVEYDEWSWPAGSSFVGRMEQALAGADRMVAVLAPEYFAVDTYGRAEREAALIRAHERDGFLVPVLVERCVLPPLVSLLSYIDLVGCDETQAAERLLSGLGGPHAPTDPVVWPGAASVPVPAALDPAPFPGTGDPPATPPPGSTSIGGATDGPGGINSWWGRRTSRERTALVGGVPATLVALAIGILTLVNTIGDSSASQTGPQSTGTTGVRQTSAPVTTTAPACHQLSTRADLTPGGSGPSASDAAVADASYDLSVGPQLQIALAGRITGHVNDGESVYLARNADPNTYDSTPKHYPGITGVFLSPEPIATTSAGCWSQPVRDLGYRCATGIKGYYYFVLMTNTDAQRLAQERTASASIQANGFPHDEILAASNIAVLASFAVPTPQIKNC
ncbi:toll/interleukin-1 receptor domain-containing protein [Frankia sp. AgB1.9]|uniref:toll/interleukin-1 receptor domain-containing protein n=1 Tax=unclassified Frankia TaxID=2632575 RepID=UPI0019314181|nr:MULTISPECIES: toll/interleukin-1 receptor domain-containing protein [unclassified Frankia]MBL7492795.1 toll/interleukin-1 receptor domain-containing protein [Frankia sp. AgW1.1]MBL7549274.1 toll/interleukin-1 receptor domain-containing protein [Frankia sp. AgB1.9]MBL7619258.1 toll/interleukin-1 receptor domain-containing protein [Frankia sp. AgB1.8]